MTIPTGTVWILANQLTSGPPNNAWVGIRISGVRSLAGTSARMRRQVAAAVNGHDEDDSAAVAKKIEQLTGQLVALQTEVASLKHKRH